MSAGDQIAVAALARLAMALDGAVLGAFIGAVAAHLWSKYHLSSRALDMVRAAPSPCISDLRSLLSSDDPDSKGVFVVVRGTVQEKASQSLLSHGTGEKAVVVQRAQTCIYNELRGLFNWNFDLYTLFARTRKEQQSFFIRSVPFVLAEEGSMVFRDSVDVKLCGSSHGLPLTTSFHQLVPVPTSSISFFHAMFGSGLPVAILDEEKILPVGKVITAVGLCRLDSGVLEIQSSKDIPFFLSDKSKIEIESDLAFDTGFFFWSGALLGTLSVGIISYSIIRNWGKLREWWHRRRHDEQPIQRNVEEIVVDGGDDEQLGDIPDGQLCVICLSRQRKSAFIPCGHLVCCPRCAMLVEQEPSPNCPLCRQSIRSSVRIYAS